MMSARVQGWLRLITPVLLSALLGLVGMLYHDMGDRLQRVDDGVRDLGERMAVVEFKLGIPRVPRR